MGNTCRSSKGQVTDSTNITGTHNVFSPSLPLHVSIIQKADPPIKSGHLLKRGFRNSTSWKNRFCILAHDGYLNYYNSRNKLKGRANFHKTEVFQKHTEPLKFYVKTIKRTWEFKGKDEQNIKHWIQVIREVSNKDKKTKHNTTNNNNINNNSIQEKIDKYQNLTTGDSNSIHIPIQRHIINKKVSFSVPNETIKRPPTRSLPKLRTSRSWTMSALEFDSDDDEFDMNRSRSTSQQTNLSVRTLKRRRFKPLNYMDKHQNRRSIASATTISMSASQISNASSNVSGRRYRLNEPTVTYDAWKISVTEALNDVIVEVQRRKNMNYVQYDDGYEEIVEILEHNSKLKDIFLRLTSGNSLMTYSQFMVSMSMLQKGRVILYLFIFLFF